MKNLLLTLLTALVANICISAQKVLYMPNEWKNNTTLYLASDPEGTATWSETRSKQNDNFIVYWDNGYGDKAPNELSKSDFYYVDIDDLLEKAEMFYQLNVNTLGFGNSPTSKVNRYKTMILINHTTEWMAYGGGYDFNCPALWINPATCKPVGHTIAHEIGHSFQYVCYSDLGGGTGFHFPQGQGSGWWEQTAQWQAAQAYPSLKWNESWTIFPRAANYAMTHEWMRYQSYWWHYYLVEKYNDREIIGKIWRHEAGTPGGGQGYDANEVLMSLKGLSVEELYKLYFEYAMKLATMDIDVDGCKEEGPDWIDASPYVFNYVDLGNRTYQVAYSSCPQATGFNIIPLNVPEAGTEVSTEFTSLKKMTKLAEGDPKQYLNGDNAYVSTNSVYYNCYSNTKYDAHRGFRLGYVALLADGTRRYLYEDKLYCADDKKSGDKTVTVTATVPEGTEKLWLVVVPAPREYYRHLWNEKMTDDDQWPYSVHFTGTNLQGAPTLDAALPTTDATITYDVELPRDAQYYTSQTVRLSGEAASVLGTAFQMKAEDVKDYMVNWTQSISNGKMMIYAVNPTTQNYVNAGQTATGYGHWFTKSGTRCEWGDADAGVFSNFFPENQTFSVGQYPGRLTVGQTYTVTQCLRYKRAGDKVATVKFVFHVKIVPSTQTGSAHLVSAEQSPLVEEILTGIDAPAAPAAADEQAQPTYYTISGTPVANPHKGIYLMRKDGKTRKVLIKE